MPRTKHNGNGQEHPPTVDLETARTLLATAKKIRADACLQEVNAVLEKHNCGLMVQQVGQNGNTIAYRSVVVALDNLTASPPPPVDISAM